jgi:hypothetical protein
MKTWRQLLATIPGNPKQTAAFGPHSSEVLSALAAVESTPWYARVGTPSDLDAQVTRVHSWGEALAFLDDEDRYVHGCILEGPWDEMFRVQDLAPDRRAWWTTARTDFANLLNAPDEVHELGLDLDHSLLLTDHMQDFANLVLIEITHADLTSCTYFREQLQWYCAGHFPCGWEGEWPAGRMRVY